MVDLDTLVLEVARSLGMLALIVLAYSELLERTQGHRLARNLCMGVLFGVGTVLSMHDPVHLTSGAVIDARGVLIGLAGPFGGYLATAIATAIAAGFRLWVGGTGAVAGIVGLAIAAGAGCAFRHFITAPIERLRLRELLWLGAFASGYVADVALLPPDIALYILEKAVPPMIGATVVGVVVFGTLLARQCRRLEAENAIKAAAVTDALTGLPNRRAFRDALQGTVPSARAEAEPVSLLMIDADHFKHINDAHGHDVGDMALVAIARVLREHLREGDFVARLGGEEFAALLPRTRAGAAIRIADRIRQAAESVGLPAGAGPTHLTISIGVAQLTAEMTDPHQLMKAADEALYRAKSAGRNRVAFPPLQELVVKTETPVRAPAVT